LEEEVMNPMTLNFRWVDIREDLLEVLAQVGPFAKYGHQDLE
jgi:hypothetical protein